MGVIGLLLAAACTGAGGVIGAKAGDKYIARERALSELMRLCRGLAGDIAYSHEPIKVLMQKYSERLTNINAYIDAYIEVLDRGLETDDKTLRQYVNQGALAAEEYDLLINMLCELGKSTADFQREGLNGVLEGFAVKYSSALSEAQKYGKLYARLGLLGGLAVGIIVL